MINCKICNREFEQITSTHLKKHDISVKEYKIRFPNEPLFTEQGRIKLSNNCKSMQSHEKFGFKKDHKANKGKIPYNKGQTKESDGRILKYSQKLEGRKISQETKNKLSKIAKQRIPRKGSLNGMFGKKLSDSHLKALHYSWRNKKTRPEIAMEMMCIQYGFKYTGDRSFHVKFLDGKRKYPDFVYDSARMAIEVFGDYWHSGENPNDLIKKYEEIGWKCLVVWESEIKMNKIQPETIEEFLGIFEIEKFSIEDFSGKWMN